MAKKVMTIGDRTFVRDDKGWILPGSTPHNRHTDGEIITQGKVRYGSKEYFNSLALKKGAVIRVGEVK